MKAKELITEVESVLNNMGFDIKQSIIKEEICHVIMIDQLKVIIFYSTDYDFNIMSVYIDITSIKSKRSIIQIENSLSVDEAVTIIKNLLEKALMEFVAENKKVIDKIQNIFSKQTTETTDTTNLTETTDTTNSFNNKFIVTSCNRLNIKHPFMVSCGSEEQANAVYTMLSCLGAQIEEQRETVDENEFAAFIITVNLVTNYLKCKYDVEDLEKLEGKPGYFYMDERVEALKYFESKSDFLWDHIQEIFETFLDDYLKLK